jgi:hypothetical protein
MLIEHDHPPSLFDPGHCRPCARHAGLVDHAIWALGSSGIGILLALLALLSG